MNGSDVFGPAREPSAGADRYYRSVAGGLIGGAAADALGWITEFVRGKEHLRTIYQTDRVTDYRPWQKVTGGRFNAYIDHINRGEYSDDTQLSLAIARSIERDGQVDVDHFAKQELPLWLDYARGGGQTVTAAAKAIQRKSASWRTNFFVYKSRHGTGSYRDAGANGAAMRIGPIALANPTRPETMVNGVWKTSIVTHGHPRAILGALTLAEAIRQCVLHSRSGAPQTVISQVSEFVATAEVPNDPDLRTWVDLWDAGATRPFRDLWRDAKAEMLKGLAYIQRPEADVGPSVALREFGCFDPATKGSGTGTVLGGLALFYAYSNDFRRAVETAVNQLGTDTDTIGAFAGSLCGAFLGYDAIPVDWARQLQDYEYFMRVATELASIAGGVGVGGQALLPQRLQRGAEGDLVEQIRQKNVNAKDVVYHPLFGRGVVESVEAQNLRRKDGARAVFARVQFYIGQSCKFRYLEFPRRVFSRSDRSHLRTSS